MGNAVAFLLSNKVSGYTTGADIVIDGGLSIGPVKLVSDEEIKALNAQD